jgi:hypothetical protein
MQPLWYEVLLALVAGYVVSFVGSRAVGGFHRWRKGKLDPVSLAHKTADPRITGFIEQLAFMPLVFAQPENAVMAMGGWLALKMAATWQKEFPTVAREDDRRGALHEILDWQSHSFQALLSGFLSMVSAGAGGIVARHLLDLPVISGWPVVAT